MRGRTFTNERIDTLGIGFRGDSRICFTFGAMSSALTITTRNALILFFHCQVSVSWQLGAVFLCHDSSTDLVSVLPTLKQYRLGKMMCVLKITVLVLLFATLSSGQDGNNRIPSKICEHSYVVRNTKIIRFIIILNQ
jgi:hypothetical protein